MRKNKEFESYDMEDTINQFKDYANTAGNERFITYHDYAADLNEGYIRHKASKAELPVRFDQNTYWFDRRDINQFAKTVNKFSTQKKAKKR